ncbi:hypothetical protein [Heliophilum fasciatum]|uniref:Tetratricopeptide repeat protein n=1 Tax=Heliophilum fasciatum TaxID=35700 RepID=A0A4V6NRT3_9FIRM|nr:hypothetical protein [Heliophilum fasciatum]MCW2276753.1 hypothetical protein [Heliophilum fasciatum]TCP68866.1 hypothetical protein EDD73_10127 [Heliophilum fasciatum]
MKSKKKLRPSPRSYSFIRPSQQETPWGFEPPVITPAPAGAVTASPAAAPSRSGTKAKTPNTKQAIEWHGLALRGDRAALQAALAFFQQRHKRSPLLTAYYADCLSLASRHGTDYNSMFKDGHQAIALFDQAVNAAPDNVEIRLLRARQSLRLPEGFFRRTATAIGDLEYLIARYEENPQLFSQEQYWQLLYDLGNAYRILEMDEECQSTWAKLLELNPPASYAEQIERQRPRSDESLVQTIDAMNNSNALITEGIRLHDLAAEGAAYAAAPAHKALQKAYELAPNQPLLLGYLGSATALLARYALEPSTQFGNTIQGMRMLKEAIEKEPSNMTLRWLRGRLTAHLPETFFPMAQKTIEDFQLLLKSYKRGASGLSPDQYSYVLTTLLRAYEQAGDSHNATRIRQLIARAQGRNRS